MYVFIDMIRYLRPAFKKNYISFHSDLKAPIFGDISMFQTSIWKSTCAFSIPWHSDKKIHVGNNYANNPTKLHKGIYYEVF